MSKRDLQKDVRKEGGYILSDGTCNMKHLLPKAHDLILEYKIQSSDLLTLIRKCFSCTRPYWLWCDMWTETYHGRIELKEDADANEVWNEVCDFFNSLAPAGYYFGSSEGDGACIGWFKYEEEAI